MKQRFVRFLKLLSYYLWTLLCSPFFILFHCWIRERIQWFWCFFLNHDYMTFLTLAEYLKKYNIYSSEKFFNLTFSYCLSFSGLGKQAPCGGRLPSELQDVAFLSSTASFHPMYPKRCLCGCVSQCLDTCRLDHVMACSCKNVFLQYVTYGSQISWSWGGSFHPYFWMIMPDLPS